MCHLLLQALNEIVKAPVSSELSALSMKSYQHPLPTDGNDWIRQLPAAPYKVCKEPGAAKLSVFFAPRLIGAERLKRLGLKDCPNWKAY